MGKNAANGLNKIDSIFKSRYHGASNIKGIRYQILYSVFRSLDLYSKDGIKYLILEGIEDLDLIGLNCENEYIQVKTSKNIWHWNNLKSIIKNFLEIYQTNQDSKFTIVLGAEVDKNVSKLIQYDNLESTERKKIKKKFFELFKGLKASKEESDYIFKNLNVEILLEKSLLNQTNIKLTDCFDVGSDLLEVYLSVLVSNFLNWAKDRSSINRQDLDTIKINIQENLSREKEYLAYGKGLIEKVSWEKDNKIEDFYEGKGTRSGHIVANIDYKREFWLKRIDTVLNSTKICIIRSSSGQGKSALLYRYAYENWPPERTFVIRKINSEDDVQHIINYLKFRASLGLPLLILVDDVNWQKKLWTSIIDECIALNVHILVTIRNEDWFRFSKEKLSDYVIEPILNIDEANSIFKVFLSKNKVYKSVVSAEWAYEQIDEPKLLMEYIYFITHGKMLHERLKDQINQIIRKKEDKAKIEILRRSTLAHILGTSVSAEITLNDVDSDEDGQFLLKSLSDEYITVDQGYLKELHQVRSEHIAKILHEEYPKLHKTALKSFDAIPEDDVSGFVRNAICMNDFEEQEFIRGLLEKTTNLDINIILGIIEGIFEAGEQLFFEHNKAVFDEVNDLVGPSGPEFMHLEFLVCGDKNILSRFSEIKEIGQKFAKIKEIASKTQQISRGVDLTKEFLIKFDQTFDSIKFKDGLSEIGTLLDWYCLCEVQMKSWPNIRENFIKTKDTLLLPLTDLCKFTQGLYKYDKDAYCEWYSRNKDLKYYLKLHTDSVKLNISPKKLYREFIVLSKDSYSKDSSEKLEILKSLIPFCEMYSSQGLYFLPLGLSPNVDETYKNISTEKLILRLDVDKNAVLGSIIEKKYLNDSFYLFDQSWYVLRKNALLFIKEFSKELNQFLLKNKADFIKVFSSKEANYLFEKNKIPLKPPSRMDEKLRNNFLKNTREWEFSFTNFFIQMHEFLADNDEKVGKLAFDNFLIAEHKLRNMHDIFNIIYKSYPDYFDSKNLNHPENKYYRECADLLDLLFVNKPKWIFNSRISPPRNLNNYLKQLKAKKRNQIMGKAQKTLFELNDEIEIILPKDVYLDPPLRYFTFAFSFNNINMINDVIGIIINKLSDLRDIADFFCIIPLFNGKKYLEGGYQISSNQINHLVQGDIKENWEALVPHKLPDKVFTHLNELKFIEESPLVIVQQLSGGILSLNTLIAYKNKIKTLKKSTNQFKIEFYKKHSEIINKYLDELLPTFRDINEFIKHNFSEFEGDKNYDVIIKLLDVLENSSVDNLEQMEGLTEKMPEISLGIINIFSLKDIDTLSSISRR